MAAEPSESQWPPSATIRTLWKLLWHIDVKKDHKENYDEEIVNSILPNPIMEVDLPDYISDAGNIVEKGIYAQGSQSKIPTSTGKDWLMNYIIRRDDGERFYPNIFDDGIAEGKTGGELNICQVTSYPLGKRYQVHVVPVPRNEHTSQAEIIQEIQDFFQTQGDQPPMYVYFDTGADLPEFLPKLEVVFDAYTRASESDAAGKPNFGSVKVDAMKPKILYEFSQTKGGKDGITYDAYNEVNPHALSQFYCKYPVTLESTGKSETQPYHIDVTMTYIKDDKKFDIVEGANTASGGRNQKVRGKVAHNSKPPPPLTDHQKEMTFISKHHGDIGQILDKDRQILLKGWTDYDKIGSKPINTAGGRHCFASIDQNPITKNFTTGADYTMFFKLEGANSKIALIRPLTVNPEAEFEYIKNQIVSHCNEIAARIKEYNDALPEFRERLPKLLASLGDLFTLPPPQPRDNPSNIYTYVVRKGAQITSTLNCIYNGSPDDIQPILLPSGTQADPTSIQFTGNLLADKKELYKIESLFIIAERRMLCPIHHVKFNPFDGNTIKPSEVETDLLFTLAFGGNQGKIEVNRIWKTINLYVDPKGRTMRDIVCRLGSKHKTFWCLDLVKQCHTLMNNWNSNLAKIYLVALNNAVKIAFTTTNIRHIPQTWIDARDVAGLPNIPARNSIDVRFIPPNALLAGGRETLVYNNTLKDSLISNTHLSMKAHPKFNQPLTRYNKTLKNLRKPNNRLSMKASPVNKLNSNAEYQLNLIEEELKQIDAVIVFYTDMLDLTDKQEIRDLYSRFFNTLYDKDTLSGGGQPVPMDMNPVQELDIMINHDTGEKINIFMTVPLIRYYESSVEQLNILLERLKTLRSDNRRRERIFVISAQLERVRQNINLYYSRELEIEREDANRPDSVEAPVETNHGDLLGDAESTEALLRVLREARLSDSNLEKMEEMRRISRTHHVNEITTHVNNRKTRNNNNNNQPRSKKPRISGRKSRYSNNTYRKK